VTVYHGCVIGERVILHAGVVIGADGFGIAFEDGRWLKVPQVGRVVIGNDVEIGANTTVDRGAIDDTVIEDGVKLDNQIQIGHNVRIGAHTAIAARTGVAGSARIGRYCRIGGHSGIAGHITLADHVEISAHTLITRSLDKPGTYTGAYPFEPSAAVAPECRPAPESGRAGATRGGARKRTVRAGKEQTVSSMDIKEVLQYLPHRYPFLLIDRGAFLRAGQEHYGAQERDLSTSRSSAGIFHTIPSCPA
jgi:carbonic anhydrase/acetyltransferase-like protein (isoleucine patch superfamily)